MKKAPLYARGALGAISQRPFLFFIMRLLASGFYVMDVIA